MPIIGIGFSKIAAEKTKAPEGKIDIRNNVTIKKIEDTEVSIADNKQLGIRVTFEFTSFFDPAIGSIILTGEVLYIGDKKELDDILKSWSKEKIAPKEFTEEILNSVLTKANIEAIILSRTIGLPPPIPLPKLKQADK